jgi:hypothetical protein
LNKILLISIIYQEFNIIQKHIDSLFPLKDIIDIVILENKSSDTEFLIKDYCLSLLEKNNILQYWLFDKNIGGTAFTIFFDSFANQLKNYDYIIITDGDIKLYNAKELLNEILLILDTVEDSFACAADIDISNLPLEAIPESINWMPKAIDHGWYLECATAGHMLTFKKENILKYIEYRRKNNEIFIDSNIRKFCISKNKKWLKTKYQKAYHLTWDLYHDLNHPYTIMKMKPREDIFFNSTYCGYTQYQMKDNEMNMEHIE